jgi:predicted nucleotidyltransferase
MKFLNAASRDSYCVSRRNPSIAYIAMNKNLTIPKDKVADFCRQHHIRRLSIFGSALRKDFAADSDVDVLVEFQKGNEPGFAFFDMEDELSKLLGRKVELNTPGFLSRYFRDRVLKEAEEQYAQR